MTWLICKRGMALTWEKKGNQQVQQVGGKEKCKKNEKGLVLFGPCWPNLGLNSDLNGAQKKVGIELGLKEEGLGEMGRGCLQLCFQTLFDVLALISSTNVESVQN